ncbi:MAG: hypothetical protein ABIQ10_17345 [Gemmatimonadaceae bacterium]
MSTYVRRLYQIEHQVIETFRVADAFTPQSAIMPPQWPSHTERQIFKRFSNKRALIATTDGRVWLDEPRYERYMQTRSRTLAIFAVGVVLITIGAIFLT